MGHTYRGPKSGCKLVTLFGGYSYDGLNSAVGVQHTEVPNLEVSLDLSWAFLSISWILVFNVLVIT